MEKNLLTQAPELKIIEESKASQIKKTFDKFKAWSLEQVEKL